MTDAVIDAPGKASLAGLLMFARPDITVRPITASDQAFCRALFHEDRGAELARLNLVDGLLTTLLDQQFHAQQMGYRQAFPNADDIIIEEAGTAVGRLMTAFLDRQTLHVIDILLSASARGRGIGTDVMSCLGEAALAQGATRVTLSVLRGNDGARRLYERLGFHTVAADAASPRDAMVKPLT